MDLDALNTKLKHIQDSLDAQETTLKDLHKDLSENQNLHSFEKEELIEAGGDDLITKPVDFTRLSLAISRLLVREAFNKQPQVKKFLDENNMPERRKNLRVAIELNCKVHADGETSYACIWDLSLGGARVAFDSKKIPAGVTIGGLIEVEFTTAWGVIKADSIVVRIGDVEPHEIGVSFDVHVEAAGDSGSLRIPLSVFGEKVDPTGRYVDNMGVTIPENLVLDIQYEKMPTGGFKVSGNIQQ